MTGVYGSGKSTVVADLGALLESRGEPYGARRRLAGLVRRRSRPGRQPAGDAVQSEGHLLGVPGCWGSAAGCGLGHPGSRQLGATREAVAVHLTVVRLGIDEASVRARLGADPTQERREQDLPEALRWLSTDQGVGLEDLHMPATLPVRQISQEICHHLGWL